MVNLKILILLLYQYILSKDKNEILFWFFLLLETIMLNSIIIS